AALTGRSRRDLLVSSSLRPERGELRERPAIDVRQRRVEQKRQVLSTYRRLARHEGSDNGLFDFLLVGRVVSQRAARPEIQLRGVVQEVLRIWDFPQSPQQRRKQRPRLRQRNPEGGLARLRTGPTTRERRERRR